MFRNRQRLKSLDRQAGFLMPLALFIVVGLGALALAISRLSGSGNTSTLYEGISVQALYAAESALQYAMHQVLFDAGSTAQADANCSATSGEVMQFSVVGLGNCEAALSCSLASTSGDTHVYALRSHGTCGSGAFVSERIVEAAVAYD